MTTCSKHEDLSFTSLDCTSDIERLRRVFFKQIWSYAFRRGRYFIPVHNQTTNVLLASSNRSLFDWQRCEQMFLSMGVYGERWLQLKLGTQLHSCFRNNNILSVLCSGWKGSNFLRFPLSVAFIWHREPILRRIRVKLIAINSSYLR